jgi:hypothetical protein
MDEDIALLADAEGAVGGLIFDGWIPPSIEVEDVTGGGQVEAGASGLEGKHKKRRSIVSLEIGDEGSAFFDWGPAVQDEAGPAEDAVEEADDIPPDIVSEFKAMGLFGLSVPEEFGGLGLTMAEESQLVRILTRASVTFRSLIGTTVGIGSAKSRVRGSCPGRSP